MITIRFFLFLALVMSFTTSAVDTELSFDNSSLFVCNAGLKTSGVQLCFQGDIKVDSCEGLSNCSCATNTKGDDYFRVTYRKWNGKLEENYSKEDQAYKLLCDKPRDCSTKNILSNTSSEFKTLTDEPGSLIVESLTFNLGSTVLGSEYFVDLCYLKNGSSDDDDNDDDDNVDDENDDITKILEFNLQSHFKTHAKSYYANAGVNVTYSIACSSGYEDSITFEKNPKGLSNKIADTEICVFRVNYKETKTEKLRANFIFDDIFNIKASIKKK